MNYEQNTKKQGKVWLVGAGPSDQELLTVKGKRLLSEADVIVYDRLAGQGVLTYGAEHAEYIDVGKHSGNHRVRQSEINQILVREAMKGKKVVRLKGGDPFVFGRGAEEAEELKKAGIPFEIVPGVTSAVSVPAYQGIPVTHRDAASSLHIITAHKKEGHEPDEIPFRELAGVKGTLVFLMGVSTLPFLCANLIREGMDPQTPAAILERGTTARQRKITGTLETLETLAKEAKIQTPAIIVVGEVCACRSLEWYDKRPLAGMKIMVTRPKEQSSRLAGMLREEGAEVLEAPAIRIVPEVENERVSQVLFHIQKYQWIVFTSPTGVEVFWSALRQYRVDVRSLSHLQIAVIGSGTARALEAYGMYADLMPEIYDGEHLGAALGEVLSDEHILIPRAKIGNPELIREIKKRSEAVIEDLPIYDTHYEAYGFINYQEEFEQGKTDYVMFTSASTVRGFAQAAKGLDFSKVQALCIGKQTKAEADHYGMQTFMAEQPTLEAMVALAKERKKTW